MSGFAANRPDLKNGFVRRFRMSLPVICSLVFGLSSAIGQVVVTTIHSFGNSNTAAFAPIGPLVTGSDGGFYGVAGGGGNAAGGTVFRITPDGQDLRVLHIFAGGDQDGRAPAPLISGTGGAFYGTTYRGGSNDAGVIFKINPGGEGYAILHHFLSANGEGAYPVAGLIQDDLGTLYGTTASGGRTNQGVVFKLNPDGTGYTNLHHFGLFGGDGTGPYASLFYTNGILYGTTGGGGTYSVGTVFRLRTDGTDYRVLHSFGGISDGAEPLGPVIQGSDGALYGLTYRGRWPSEPGMLYRLNAGGLGYSVIRTNLAGPRSGLIQPDDGMLYGTTIGTVFKVNPDGTSHTNLHVFDWINGDGYEL